MTGWAALALLLAFVLLGALVIAVGARPGRDTLDLAELERRREFEAAMRREHAGAQARWEVRVSRARDTGATQVGNVLGAWLVVLALLALMGLAGGIEGAGL